MTRYTLPDPQCRHARRGIVKAGDPHGAYAAADVCDRPDCIADAIAWAEATTREPASHVPDQGKAEEPTLFPEMQL